MFFRKEKSRAGGKNGIMTNLSFEFHDDNEKFALLRRRTWAQIDLDRAGQNYRTIRAAIRPDAKLCCVVKANAYGHSAVELSRLYESLGADYFAVSNIEEALQLRRGGVKKPILILGYTAPCCAEILAREDIAQCVYSAAFGHALADRAEQAGVRVKIHVKIDTGMGRIGFSYHDSRRNELSDALSVCRRGALVTEGIFTHFASADENQNGKAYTEAQFERFGASVDFLEKNGVHFAVRHCANSAAVLDYPQYALDMVRAGVILYGLAPSGETAHRLSLSHVMTLYSVIAHIKTVYPGDKISYGRTYEAKSIRRIATVPIGYADGFWRRGGNGAYSLCVNGKACPTVGRVCMDQLMIDVTDADCSEGDRVTVFGNDEPFTPESLAAVTDTIGYEVICAVGERVPRAFVHGGKIVSIRDNVYDEDL